MHENVKKQVDEILSKIPASTGLTDDEVRLELAMKIVEDFPRGIHDDTDLDLDEAMDLIQEAAVYYGGTIHKD